MPVEIFDPDTFGDLVGVEYDMPWPAKLADASYAPAATRLRLPVIEFKTVRIGPFPNPDAHGLPTRD